jgi:ABC-type transport system involved in multi-copper enzyme maturation permease subunit
MMTQTLAIFHDAYRELNAKKLFWFVLIISGIVVIAFAGTGINARGITLFGIEFQMDVNTSILSKAMWYKTLFSQLGIGFWLTWCAMTLALVSTASIFPDFIAGGSIDLYLSRPISRIRLFLTKYVSGLLFVGLQVGVFALACFLVIGVRGGAWEPKVFLSIPLVLLVFSYLFCICVLFGLITRSAITSLLLTMLVWLLIFGVDLAEKSALSAKIAGEIETTAYSNMFDYKDKQIALAKERLATGDATAKGDIDRLQAERKALEEKKRTTDPGRRNWAVAERLLVGAKTFFPKTSETNSLIDRWMKITDEIGEERAERRQERRARWMPNFGDRTKVALNDPEVARETGAVLRERPVSWVMGTSVAFELVVLGISAWIFCRRDF